MAMRADAATSRVAAPAPRSPRIWAAVAAAVVLHVAFVTARSGVLGSRHAAPAVPLVNVMAVRAIPAVPTAATLPSSIATPVLPPPAEPPLVPAAPRSEAIAAQVQPLRAEPAQRSPRSPAASESDPPPVAAAPSTVPERTPAVTVAPALAAAPDYALGVRLDPGPRPLDDIEPEYPDPHLREGTVILRVLISDAGQVDRVDVVRAEPLGVFEQAAVDAFAKARFSPGLAAGKPVKSQITVEVNFMPINRGARISGRGY